MHKFKDNNGLEWEIELNIAVVKKIRNELEVDLNALTEGQMADITTKPETLVDIISVICTPQIVKRELDEYSFANCMIGEAIDNAYEALVKELIFISRHNQRQVVARAWETVQKADKKLTSAQLRMLESPEMDQKINKMIQGVEEKFENI